MGSRKTLWAELADDLRIGRQAARVAQNGLVIMVIAVIILGVAGFLSMDFDASEFVFSTRQVAQSE